MDGKERSKMKKYIFYHIFLCERINEMIYEQLTQLEDLLNDSELFITVVDVFNGKYVIDTNIIKKYNCQVKYVTDNRMEMMPTLQSMYQHALKHDGHYLYIHTKGCSHINQKDHVNEYGSWSYKNVENWRHIMEHFTIQQWKVCDEALDEGYDLVGCNYNGWWGTPHYSGLFFWTKSEYLRKLPDPYTIFGSRMDCEMWVTRIKHKALCLYPLPKDNHNRSYVYTPKEEYFNNIIKTEFNL